MQEPIFNIDNNFERRLIEHLQPIRQHVLAINLYHLFDTGIYRQLQKEPCSVGDLAAEMDLDLQRLAGFFEYLHNEDIVILDGDLVSLSDKGRAYEPFIPWYTMLVGGYAGTFMQIGDKLKKGTGWATRDVAKVGLGSCGISYYDAIPLTRMLMREMDRPCKKLLDLGCGNALYLTEFCKTFPEIEAWGVEPDAGGCEEALVLIEQEGMSDRIQITCAPAMEFLDRDLGDYYPDLLVFGFILQEILAQEGEEKLTAFVRHIFEKFPDIYVVVIEVDNQVMNPQVMAHGLSLGYYNPYYLLHKFTEQTLTTPEFWENLFEHAGVEVVAKKTTLPEADSTGLEIGYLLKKSTLRDR